MNLRERGESLEDKFQQDKFLEFKITARRNKKIGMWAANLLGISPSEAEKFISNIVSKITHDPDDSKLLATLTHELKKSDNSIPESQIRRQLGYFHQEAKRELSEG